MVEQSIFINNNELKNWINNTYDLRINKVLSEYKIARYNFNLVIWKPND